MLFYKLLLGFKNDFQDKKAGKFDEKIDDGLEYIFAINRL